MGLVGALAACSGSDANTGGAGGGTSSGGGSSTGGDGGTSSGGGSGGTSTGVPEGDQIASLSVTQYLTGAAADPGYLVNASLWQTPIMGSNDCTQQEVGSCVVTTCGPTQPIDLPPQYDAGEVTFTTPTSSLTLSFMNGGYASGAQSGFFFEPEALLETTVAGSADVAAFDAMVTAPGSVVIDSASLTPVISQSAPFTFSWTGSGGGEVVFAMSTRHLVAGESVERVSFWCTVPISDETLTVPLEAVSPLLVTQSTNCPGATCDETTTQITLSTFTDAYVDLADGYARLSAAQAPSHSSGMTTPSAWTVVP
jgi:hypothetical protein